MGTRILPTLKDIFAQCAIQPLPMSAASFTFNFAVFQVAATIEDDVLVVKTGMKTIIVPLPKLQHVYVSSAANREHEELLLAHRTPKGTLKRSRIYANLGDDSFAALVQTLISQRPETDISHLSLEDAWQKTGSKPLKWTAIPIALLGLWLLVAVLMTPFWVHGLDTGSAQISATALIAGEPINTRNLAVRGHADLGRSVADNGADGRRPPTTWIPLGGAPASLILKVRGELDPELITQTEFTGILRNIWWEGLSWKAHDLFRDAKIPLSDHVLVLEYQANPQDDLTLGVGSLFGFLLLIGGVAWGLRRREVSARPKASIRPDSARL